MTVTYERTAGSGATPAAYRANRTIDAVGLSTPRGTAPGATKTPKRESMSISWYSARARMSCSLEKWPCTSAWTKSPRARSSASSTLCWRSISEPMIAVACSVTTTCRARSCVPGSSLGTSTRTQPSKDLPSRIAVDTTVQVPAGVSTVSTRVSWCAERRAEAGRSVVSMPRIDSLMASATSGAMPWCATRFPRASSASAGLRARFDTSRISSCRPAPRWNSPASDACTCVA